MTNEQKQKYRDEFNEQFVLHTGTGNPVLVKKQKGSTGWICDLDTVADYWLQKMEEREKEIVAVIETNKQRSNVADDESEEYWLDYEDVVNGIKNI